MRFSIYSVIAVLFASLFLIQGCGDDETTAPEGLYPPSFLEIDQVCGGFDLGWTLSADDTNDDFGGYMIFRDTFDLEFWTEEEILNYFIAQVAPGESTFTDQVSNDVEYYYQVRAFDDENDLSSGTDAGPTDVWLSGTGIMYENASDNGSYFIFYPNGETVPIARADEADIALNTQSAEPVLKSADQAQDGVRVTSIAFQQTAGSSAEFEEVVEVDLSNSVYELEIAYHDVIALYTEGDQHYVKMWITSGDAGSPLDGSGVDEYVEFEWVYQTVDDCEHF